MEGRKSSLLNLLKKNIYIMIHEKFFYFQETFSADTASTIGSGDVAMYPVSSFLGFDSVAGDTNATTLNMRFKPLLRSASDSSAATADDVDLMALTVTANKQKDVIKAITDKLNEPLSRDSGFIVIADNEGADGTSPEYVSEHITSVVVTIRAAS